MKKIIALLVLALIGFYVAWPAWSAYKIATALGASDAGTLESKVDFPAVRESLRPAVTREVEKRMDKETQSLGAAGGVLGGDLKKQLLPKLVEQVLAAVVTPERVIRLAHDGGDIAKSVEKIFGEAAGQIGALAGGISGSGGAPAGGNSGGVLGGILGAAGAGGAAGGVDLGGLAGKVLGGMKKPDDAAPAPAASGEAPKKRSFGLGNIKGFGFAGPLGFDLSVARDAVQPKADATDGMSFTGGDWKLTRVVPNL